MTPQERDAGASAGKARARLRRLTAAAVLTGALALGGAGLWQATATGGAPSREEQARSLAAELRCPVCQGTSVADSPSETARAMRRVIDEQLAGGQSPDQVLDWFVDRYGSWILLDPPAGGPGLALWLLPAAGVLGGGAVAIGVTRRRGAAEDEPASPGDGPSPDRGELDAVLDDVLAGRLDPGESLAGERLTGLAVLLADVRSDDPTGRSAATVTAEAEAAAAVLAWRTEQAERPEPTAVAEERVAAPAATASARSPRRARRLAWTALVTAFVAALAVLLLPSLRARTAGDLITGDPLLQPRPAAQATGGAPPEDLPFADDVAALERMVADAPDDAGWRIALGDALDLRGRTPEALEQYQQARGLRPEDPAATLRLAFVRVRTGDVPGGRKLLGEVLAADPDQPDALLLLGMVELGAGEPTGPQRLERFLQVAPDHPAVRQVRDTLGQQAGTGPP